MPYDSVMDTNISTAESLAEDFAFAKEQTDELRTMADVLRYVAAINIGATRAQFVAAAVASGYAANTSDRRFRESRNADVQFGAEIGQPVKLEKDGRLTILV